MELALIVSLIVLSVVAVVGLLGFVIDRGAGRLER